MSTVQELIKDKKVRQLKSEVSFIRSSLVSAMAIFEMTNDDSTKELYNKLNNACEEALKVEELLEKR
jgi:hypothetical protein